MITYCTKDKEKVLKALREGKIDTADVCYPNLVDEMVLEMRKVGILEDLGQNLKDKRASNKGIPLYLILVLAIVSKMKIKTSLTDIPYAIHDADTMSELGFNLFDTERDLEKGLMEEGSLRNFVKKYTAENFIQYYNDYVQDTVMKKLHIAPDIHILDCTEIEVELNNDNYEGSEVKRDEKGVRRGYKLASLRGIYEDTGIIEEIKLGSIKQHDLAMCKPMLLESPVMKPKDILINDRGFIDRDLMNQLKAKREIDTYIPVKKNMEIFEQAVSIAKDENAWKKHPNKKRKTQKIAFVESLKEYWKSKSPEDDVEINACVVYDEKVEEYFVFVTTDTSKSAKQIILTYELRPEIEEDFRQLKDFWKIEDFKSRKYNFIAFHIVMVLIGYLFFQVYRCTELGKKFAKKSLPIAIKKFVSPKPKTVVIFSGHYFATFGFLEFIQLYASCETEVKKSLDMILAQV
jgi:hypothetical protein